MSHTIIDAPPKVTEYVDQIRQHADENRDALGFLPVTAYGEAALKGRLWVAVASDAPASTAFCGYLLFGDRFPRLRVFQVYVRSGFRKSGIARSLIEKLKAYGEGHDYLTISARVASELAANSFWKSLGFRVAGQSLGGKKGRTINRYALPLDVPSLFGQQPSASDTAHLIHVRPVLDTPRYAIDLNVLFDALRDRDNGAAIRILSLGFDSDLRLAVTSEFARELERHSADSTNDTVLALARALPTLPEVTPHVLSPLLVDLHRILSSTGPPKVGRRAPNDASDLVHLASCIHHRVYGFLTRDGRILQKSEELHKQYKLRVLSPTDLLEPLDDASHRYQPVAAAIGQQEIAIHAFNESRRADADHFLRDLGVPRDDISACLAPGRPGFPATRSVVQAGGRVLGIGSWHDKVGAPRECHAHLYVDDESPYVDRAVDHFLEHSITRGDYGHLSRVDLTIDPGQVRIRDVAIKRGFCSPDFGSRAASEALSKVSMNGMVTEQNWPLFRGDFEQATGYELPIAMPRYQDMIEGGIALDSKGLDRPITLTLFDFETLISPGALVSPDRHATLVPVQPRYARELLSLRESQGNFLVDREVVLRLERAYFLRAGRHQLLSRGTIVVFYVSHHRSEAVAVARVTSSGNLTKSQAVLNLSRQGVLTEEEIQRKANRRGEVGTFTFDNLIVFRSGMPHRELKRLDCIGGANLVTAQRLEHDKLRLIVDRVFDLGTS